jgi:signal transduction histidine kinase
MVKFYASGFCFYFRPLVVRESILKKNFLYGVVGRTSMSAETYLHRLAQQVCHLLECQAAILLLECPDPLLCHPLLRHRPLEPMIYSTDDTFEYSLLDTTLIGALCDIAMQTGAIWCLDDSYISLPMASSLLIVPIESTHGTCGVLLCVNGRSEQFLQGEYSLLFQYLPTLIRNVEAILHEAYHSTRSAASTVFATMREQNTYISMVSHELRSPLTAIKGYAGLLHAYGVADVQEGYAAREMTTVRQRRYLTAIMEQVEHLEVLIADLLDISRLQAGRLSLHCSETNVSQLCQRVVASMRERVEKQSPRHYRFHSTIEPNLPLAWADPDRLRQILVNLLENAVKYSPDGGVIELFAYSLQQHRQQQMHHSLFCSAGKQTQTCEVEAPSRAGSPSCMIGITICDRGIGIPHAQQDALFQPFTRLRHPASEQIAGAGLGLYIARCLVEAMDGQIFLHSQQGEGTRVTFTIPAV